MSSISFSIPNSNRNLEHKSFGEHLASREAFYRKNDYLENTKKDFASEKLLPVTYRSNIESKVARIVKLIFSIIIFPIGLCRLLHSLAGRLALPASTKKNDEINKMRNLVLEQELQNIRKPSGEQEPILYYKRLTLAVDGYKVDATITGTAGTLNNGRWLLSSVGNAGCYENELRNHDFKQIITKLNSNAIVFNYPGVGSSSGLPNRKAMEKAYRVVLKFLEDEKDGIGAKEIIGYGHSIGAGVQAEALKNHKLKDDVQYAFVKSRTFSKMNEAAKHFSPVFSVITTITGWNIDAVNSSKKLNAPEIIIQTAQIADDAAYEILQDSSKIIDDGIIPKNASLVKALLDSKCTKNKVFIGVRERHNEDLNDSTIDILIDKIEEALSPVLNAQPAAAASA